MKKSPKFSPEVRERAVRMVQEHRGEYPVDSTRKLSQVSASILSHWFKGSFGYSNVDKSTSVSASWTPFLGFCRTDLVVRA